MKLSLSLSLRGDFLFVKLYLRRVSTASLKEWALEKNIWIDRFTKYCLYNQLFLTFDL
jgi:hypothetical protein